jgi:ABC-type lipoprotein release transport system permease subunit
MTLSGLGADFHFAFRLLLASLIPARRATRVHPAEVMRSE